MGILSLTTKERVLAYLELKAGSNWAAAESLLDDALIPAVSQRIERLVDRSLLLEARTERFDLEPGQRILWLSAFPVSASPALEVRADFQRLFGDGTVVDPLNYALDLEGGRITFDGFQPVAGAGVVQVVYTGGIAEDTDGVVEDYPELASACEMQCAYILQRRANFGGTVQQAAGASTTYQAQLKLLDDVKEILSRYRRRA